VMQGYDGSMPPGKKLKIVFVIGTTASELV
jgi:hypothetical protein